MPASFTSQVMAALGRLKLFTTAALPSSAPPGQLVYDTTADAPKVVKNDGVTYATISTGGAAATGFDAITSGTNTTAAMVVSTGASLSVQDAVFGIIGSGDASKIARFEVDGFTAANTRVFTLPGSTGNDTIMTLASVDTITGNKTFSGTLSTFNNATTFNASVSVALNSTLGFGASASMGADGGQTPDSLNFFINAASNSVGMKAVANFGADQANGMAGTAACTQIAHIIHGTANNTTEYNHLNMFGSHGGNVTTLTDNVATTFMHSPALTAGQIYAGTGTYVVKVVDAANETQVAAGSFEWYIMRGNTGGTVAGIQQVGNDGVLPGLPLKAVSSGTLTVALSVAVAANVASFQMTADTSLTATTFTMTTQMDTRTAPAEMIID